jgi:hypothetical protein
MLEEGWIPDRSWPNSEGHTARGLLPGAVEQSIDNAPRPLTVD